MPSPPSDIPERILKSLKLGPLTSTELCERLGIISETLWYHLKRLKSQGKIVDRGEGKLKVWYRT